jgi:hypothetical protein
MSRDGRVAFASERDGKMEIYVWGGASLANVSLDPRTDDYPAWSADGRLAWLSDRSGSTEVYVWDGLHIFNASQAPNRIKGAPCWTGSGLLVWSDGEEGPSGSGRLVAWNGQAIFEVARYNKES